MINLHPFKKNINLVIFFSTFAPSISLDEMAQ